MQPGARSPAPHEGLWQKPDVILASLAALLSLVSILRLEAWLGFALFNQQKILAIFGLFLAAAFLRYPARKSSTDNPIWWFDWCTAGLALAAAGYASVEYQSLIERLFDKPLDAIICASLLTVLLLEALRRSAGTTLFVVALLFLLFGLIGHLLPGDFQGRKVDLIRLVTYLGLDANAMIGAPLAISTSVVFAFLLFGAMLGIVKGDEFFTRIAMLLVGRQQGGASKIAVLASMLFGTVSGSAVASVATTGSITIPLMLKNKMKPEKAAAIEAVASTGGQLMPPMMGAAAFIMAEFLRVEFRTIAYSALLPSLLYYFAIYVMISATAKRFDIPALDVELNWTLLHTLRQAVLFLGPLTLLIVFLFVYRWKPDHAAIVAVLILLALNILANIRDLPKALGTIPRALADVGTSMISLAMIAAMAGLVIGILNITGLGFAFTLFFAKIGTDGGLFLLLLVAAAASILLGMGMPTLGVYLLLGTLVAPSIAEFGVSPIAAHLFCLYFGVLSLISPPVALASFTAAGIANASPIGTAIEGMKIGWLAYVVPFLFVYSPALIGLGGWAEILWSLFAVGIGVIMISMAVVGYHRTVLPPLPRLAYFAAGAVALTNCALDGSGAWTILSNALVWVIAAYLPLSWFVRRLAAPPKPSAP